MQIWNNLPVAARHKSAGTFQCTTPSIPSGTHQVSASLLSAANVVGTVSILLLLSHRAIYLLYSLSNPTSIMLLRCTPLTDVCVGLQPVACFQLMMSVLLAFSCNLLPLLAFRLFQFVNSFLWTLSLRPSQVSHMFSLVRWP